MSYVKGLKDRIELYVSISYSKVPKEALQAGLDRICE